MRADAVEEADQCADNAMSSMRGRRIPTTPQNFAIWYEYHEGSNPSLCRAIDLLLSNGHDFREVVLEELYEKFFTAASEQRALRETSRRIEDTLKEVISAVGEAGDDTRRFGVALRDISGEIAAGRTSLAELIAKLVIETREMSSHSDLLNLNLTQSSQTIGKLKTDLDHIRRDATTDVLTGIANRRLFDMSLREAVNKAMENGRPLTLLMLDIDHFKRFNDSWGHHTGDEVLKLVAQTLKETVKGQDVVARYGGDEFAIVLPETQLDDAIIVGNNIRRAFERRRITKKASNDLIGGITVAVGAARYECGEPIANLVERADAALYRAKRDGRNRVVAEVAAAHVVQLERPSRPQGVLS